MTDSSDQAPRQAAPTGDDPARALERIRRLEAANDELAEKLAALRSQYLALDDENAALRRDRQELSQIKGMIYYRLARKLDAVKRRIGLARRQPAAPTPETPPASPRQPINTPPPPPASSPEDSPQPLKRLAIGVILDKFTRACFEPESHLVSFRPDNWRRVLEAAPPRFLFVESAWSGNEGAWLYRIGQYDAPAGNELDDVLNWCRRRGIPSVFWNKEDPPHFEMYFETAARFDYIFTTDANCIPRYRERLNHDRIAALPFAAQPAIHNPVLYEPRKNAVCFAGAYYADDFEERRRDLDVLLAGSREFGLDIFDRMHGYDGHDSHLFKFPREFQPHIRGKLEYEEMLRAYRAWRLFVNVNSVYDSPTMFSRRVFELLACGTPVVSTRSLGLTRFFGDLVPQVQTPEEARAALGRLMRDDEAWRRASHRGVRLVLSEHTYEHRLREICKTIGLSIQPAHDTIAVIVIPAGDPARLAASLAAQTDAPAVVVIAGGGDAARAHETALRAAGFLPQTISADSLGAFCRDDCSREKIAFIDSRHWYGPNYLRDARLALDFSPTPLTGLSTYFQASDSDAIGLNDAGGEEQMIREEILAPTAAAFGAALSDEILRSILNNRTVRIPGGCYARSRYEFLADCPAGRADSLTRQVCL